MTAYYNEVDRFCCDWLQNLMDANLITPGKIDDRSIVDVRSADVKGYERVHFFAGIGGWDIALNMAGWKGRVWTGSCPCQPYSIAGQRRGSQDPRNLWPHFLRIIFHGDPQPPVIFGEQVASPAGREWFTGVRADLESVDYAVGAADLCAAGVGAPHIRQRLYWLAYFDKAGWGDLTARQACAKCDGLGTDGMGGWSGDWDREGEPRRFEDGSQRRTKPSVDIMVDGFPGRVDTVGALGNAIVPKVAATFIQAAMSVSP